MALELYFHPLSSYCQKAIVALYENETPFEGRLVDLSDPVQRAALAKLWPLAKFPVLRDHARDQTVPEASSPTNFDPRAGTTPSVSRMRRRASSRHTPCSRS